MPKSTWYALDDWRRHNSIWFEATNEAPTSFAFLYDLLCIRAWSGLGIFQCLRERFTQAYPNLKSILDAIASQALTTVPPLDSPSAIDEKPETITHPLTA